MELEENVPDRLADDAVVLMLKVPAAVAVVPDAVTVNENVADPAPPETSSSSASDSSNIISIKKLLCIWDVAKQRSKRCGR